MICRTVLHIIVFDYMQDPPPHTGYMQDGPVNSKKH